MAQSGFRGSEVALSASHVWSKRCLSRASVLWSIQGVIYGGSANPRVPFVKLARLENGDFAMVIPPPSKCDKFGIAWGNDPIYLAYHHSDQREICAARSLSELEMAHPIEHAEQRRKAPLFCDDDGKMFKRSWLATTMKHALAHIGVPEARLAKLTLHSFRRYLACALRAQNATDSQIMAMLRWRSPKSLQAYAALNAGAYASLIDSAGDAVVDSIRMANAQYMPTLSAVDVAFNFAAARDRLTRDAERTDEGVDREAADEGEDE
jgi:hypothetical protein